MAGDEVNIYWWMGCLCREIIIGFIRRNQQLKCAQPVKWETKGPNVQAETLIIHFETHSLCFMWR